MADWKLELVQNNRQLGQLEALVNLWRSLGRPASGFWLYTAVFYKDMYLADSLAKQANDKGQAQRPKAPLDHERSEQ